MKKFMVPVFLAILLATAGCVSQPTANAAATTADENLETPEHDISVSAVIAGFEPREITVKKDVPVRLSVTSKEIDPKFTAHGLSIKEFGIDEKIQINETKVIEFTPDKTGSFVFFCSVFCGQGHVGQAGILHVIE